MATYLQLAQKLRQDLGVNGSGPAAVTSQVDEMKRMVDWIADAWTEIQSKHPDWSFHWSEFSQTVTAGTADYTVETDVRTIIRDTVRLDGTRLQFIDYSDYARRFSTAATFASSFTILPTGMVRMLPAVAGTLTGEYYRTPQTLAANTDEPLAPAHLHEVIIAQAMLYYAAYEDAPEIYQDASARLRRWMTRLQNECLPSIDMPGPLV